MPLITAIPPAAGGMGRLEATAIKLPTGKQLPPENGAKPDLGQLDELGRIFPPGHQSEAGSAGTGTPLASATLAMIPAQHQRCPMPHRGSVGPLRGIPLLAGRKWLAAVASLPEEDACRKGR
ncbi:hypothetical protein ILYODFUR_028711 [Ilyodon furcidens]|uniref:Uncharacterized protein n=1 Tax=Ilyodon furcidens TaxID=33524 RepID=A0ABV0VI74_9TELE